MLARVIAGSVCRASGEILSRGLPCAKKQDQNNRVHARAQLRAPYMVGRPLRKKRSGAGRFKFGLGRRTRTRKTLLLHQAASREELMKRTLFALIAGVAIAYGSAALGEMIDTHKVFLPQDIKWGATPPSLPAGAEAAVLYGDPQKEGMFALRIKAPKGYRIAPHTHSKPEVITVISGKFSLGMGSKADRASVESLPAGSFSSMPPGVGHYVFVDEDAVVQINSTGPWTIDYVDPKDDPRLNIAPAK